MLSASALTKFLSSVCSDGVDHAIVVNSEGSLLGVGTAEEVTTNILPEITSSFLTNIWENYAGTTGSERIDMDAKSSSTMSNNKQRPLKDVFLKLENGVIAMAKVNNQYLVCVCGANTVNEMALRARLSGLIEELTRAMAGL